MKYSFGIIICTYNRCQSLKNTIESLLKQECDWSRVAEIIIIDNNSADATQKLVNSYADSFQTKFISLRETRQGKSYALNLGITTSHSDVLIFTDDDVVLDPHWLGEIIRFFEANEVDVLGGRVLPVYSPHFPPWVKHNQYYLRGPIVSYDYGEDTINFNTGKITAFIGANVAYKRSVFDDTGLYNIELGVGRGTLCEDIEMFVRAVKKGKKIIYHGKALVNHPVDPQRITLRYIAKWNFLQGKSTAMLEAVEDGQKLSCIAGVPRYLFRSVVIKLAKLLASAVRPKTFLKQWCALFFNLGMVAGYRKHR